MEEEQKIILYRLIVDIMMDLLAVLSIKSQKWLEVCFTEIQCSCGYLCSHSYNNVGRSVNWAL